jgi:hypothetical protein
LKKGEIRPLTLAEKNHLDRAADASSSHLTCYTVTMTPLH